MSAQPQVWPTAQTKPNTQVYLRSPATKSRDRGTSVIPLLTAGMLVFQPLVSPVLTANAAAAAETIVMDAGYLFDSVAVADVVLGASVTMLDSLQGAHVADLFTATASVPFYEVEIAGTTAAAESPAIWLKDQVSRINRFSSLQDRWDSYGAKRISRTTIGKALGVVSLLAEAVSRKGVRLTETPFAAPMSSGGILFEIKNGNRELHLEVEPGVSDNYEAYRISDDPSAEESENDPAVSESGLPEVLSWIVNIR